MADTSKNAEAGSSTSRLWVLSELYYPEETSTGFYLTRIAEGLADEWNVGAICCQPNYAARAIKAPRQERRNNVEIFRVRGTRLDKNWIPLRVVNMLTSGISMFFCALSKIRAGDRVLVVTTPPTLPFVAAAAALFRGAAYTLLIHDNYPEILVASGKAAKSSAVARISHFANRWLYKNAAQIVVVGRDMAKLLAKKTHGLDVPIATIQNWGEVETVRPRPRSENQMLAELGLTEKFVFLYAGNLGYPNDVETIARAAIRLKAMPEIHFVFLGTGVKRKWCERFVAEHATENITLLAPRPREDQIEFLNACDVAIVSLVSQMWGVSMPSRTYNILAAGKPILALTEPGSEVEQTIADDDLGWVVPPGDVDAFVEAVVNIVSQRQSLAGISERARAAVESRFGYDAAIMKYRELFRPCAAKRLTSADGGRNA